MVGATSLGYPESMKVLNLCVSPAFKTGYCISNQNCHSSFQAKKSCLTINSFIQTHHAPTKPRTHDTRDPWPSCCLRVSFKKKFHLSSKCRWIQNHAGEELTSHLGCFSKTQKLTLVSSVFLHGNTLPLPKITHLLDIQTPWGLVFEVCCEKGAQSLPFTSRGGIFGCRLGQEIWMTNFPKQSVAETCHDFSPPPKKKKKWEKWTVRNLRSSPEELDRIYLRISGKKRGLWLCLTCRVSSVSKPNGRFFLSELNPRDRRGQVGTNGHGPCRLTRQGHLIGITTEARDVPER